MYITMAFHNSTDTSKVPVCGCEMSKAQGHEAAFNPDLVLTSCVTPELF